jgi:TPP-dependent indolepyruvate ferredoxin oxidoreductase alpha subunit
MLIVLRVDMFLYGGAASLVTELGTIPGEPISFGVYKFEIQASEGDFIYRYMDDSSIQELDERSIFISSPMSLDAVCFNSPVICPGCTNPEFYEFNPYATSDALMCQTAAAIGCTYSEALNFDGTCLFTDVSNDNCPGDLNLDGTIGADDLLIFLIEWGTICF